MQNSISKEFDFKSLLIFAFPTIIMMVFMSLYTIVDGIFVARYVGSNAVASINIVMPVINLLNSIGIMFASGGNAVISKKIGEGKSEEANEDFSFINVVCLLVGVIIAVVCFIFMEPMFGLLGASETLLPLCMEYGFFFIISAPLSIIKCVYDQLLVTAGHPKLALKTSIVGGVTNIVLDYLFIVIFGFGIVGAAIATVIGQIVAVWIAVQFFRDSENTIHFTKFKKRYQTIKEAMINGSSEMVSQLSFAITTVIFNLGMMKYAGESGVAAISIILYIQFIMIAVFIGFSNGIAPVVGYSYGSQNRAQLKRIYRYSNIFIWSVSIFVFILSQLGGEWIIRIFIGSTDSAYALSVHGLYLFSFSFIFNGFTIFSSGFFTALSNGPISAAISFLKNLVFIVVFAIVLPPLWGIDGLWLCIPFAEFVAFFVALFFLLWKKKEYGY
ncbi:putative MATE family efflux protein [Breznakia sp. PF5-3]|uniref:MATE family efflux transporter n=1 Tax=unclassified Breznakia TaxID=2623764 RepID=UPI002407066E|nr:MULTISPECIES: MATE family efflux transporter [unclassified Breznakia]MDF9823688.1 putative MATE family efflux protein [Breznakia sp. PM6-1]MDF9834486.1 putative MATE family efflux protein [Breznakia sp. PF5-3]MDF9837543.1 putative MATE family efflux protein [Breznakia sp. PFB2-8]MDF9859120.1 putative MATE family efflux protein [Breznakia sp. PH5-24]